MDPLSHKLAEFPFQIGAGKPLSGMLDQLKGARLELKFGNDTVTGAIVNGRVVAGSDKQAGARTAHPACSIRASCAPWI